MCIANRQLRSRFPKYLPRLEDSGQHFADRPAARPAARIFTVYQMICHMLRCIRKITPQLPITWKGNCAIWMPGN